MLLCINNLLFCFASGIALEQFLAILRTLGQRGFFLGKYLFKLDLYPKNFSFPIFEKMHQAANMSHNMV